jgi:hypothetical protein
MIMQCVSTTVSQSWLNLLSADCDTILKRVADTVSAINQPWMCFILHITPPFFLTDAHVYMLCSSTAVWNPNLVWLFLLSPLYVECIFHLTLLELMTLIMFGEEMKLQSSSLCSSLQSAVTSLCDQLSSSAICFHSPACHTKRLTHARMHAGTRARTHTHTHNFFPSLITIPSTSYQVYTNTRCQVGIATSIIFMVPQHGTCFVSPF